MSGLNQRFAVNKKMLAINQKMFGYELGKVWP